MLGDAKAVLTAITLEMEQGLFRNVSNELGFLGKERIATGAKKSGLITFVAVVRLGALIPGKAIRLVMGNLRHRLFSLSSDCLSARHTAPAA